MVKHLISSILFLCFMQSGQAQITPWFFSTNGFKEWIKKSHVKEMVELNPEFENFENYNDYIPKLKHSNNTDISQVEVHYYFDSLGELISISLILKKISLPDSNYKLQKDEYNHLLKKFELIPYALSDSVLRDFIPVKGMEHLKIKSHKKNQTILMQNGDVISQSGSIKKTTENYFAFYTYSLLLKLNFKNGFFQSSESYLHGSADTQGLPYYFKTWFEKERDSIYLLKTHSYIPDWIDDKFMEIRDSIENLFYYRNTLTGNSEGECYLDSLGNLFMSKPIIQYFETPTKSGSEFHFISTGKETLISLYDAYFYNPAFDGRANFGQSYHYYGANLGRDQFFMKRIAEGEHISTRQLDKNGLLKRERFSKVKDGKNQLIWDEQRTDDGFLRIQKIRGNQELRTEFKLNNDGSFEVVENKVRHKDIISSKSRLEFTNNGFIADQNGSTKKITYIVYK